MMARNIPGPKHGHMPKTPQEVTGIIKGLEGFLLPIKSPWRHPCLIWQKWTKQHTDVMFRLKASIH